jgi:uncharacterized protein YabE (DUF348 family)
MLRPIKLDGLIENGLKQAKTVDAVMQEIASDTDIRDAVQNAIDNPPPTQTPDGHAIYGASYSQHIRQALMAALQAT